IPHLRVDDPRVTHPSATPLLLRAFDLHVLGTPPAFILSQDQTRHPCFYSPAPHTEETVRCMLSAIQSKTMLFAWLVRLKLTETASQQLLYCFPLFSCQSTTFLMNRVQNTCRLSDVVHRNEKSSAQHLTTPRFQASLKYTGFEARKKGKASFHQDNYQGYSGEVPMGDCTSTTSASPVSSCPRSVGLV